MPYVLNLVCPLVISETSHYINDCCVGGDLVLNRLIPSLRARYGELTPTQEDWGWLIWFEHAGVKLAIDVHTDDQTIGSFRIHLTSRKPRLLFGSKIQDTPELQTLRDLITAQLQSWDRSRLEVERVDAGYMPIQ